MSINRVILKITFGLTGIVGVAFGIHAFMMSRNDAQDANGYKTFRKNASVGSPKGYLAMGKPNRTLDIHIDEVPVEGFNGTRLGVTVKITRPVDNAIQMEWEIPAGVQMLSGEREFWIQSLNPGESYYSEIDVTGLKGAPEERIVRLEGSVNVDGVAIASEGIYSSHIMQKDLSIRQRAPASMSGILRRKAVADEKMPRLHF